MSIDQLPRNNNLCHSEIAMDSEVASAIVHGISNEGPRKLGSQSENAAETIAVCQRSLQWIESTSTKHLL